jgi:arsenite methyltransferase
MTNRTTRQSTAQRDRWSQWVLEQRDAGDARQRALALAHLAPIRDRVLAGAEPLEGATLLDLGTGDGLIGLEALDRVGAGGTVIFVDVSPALVEQCRQAVRSRDGLDHARFVVAGAENLAEVPDASVDALTTRSVLIYVANKARAFEEMHRVLRPEGRISLFEPINRFTFPEPADRFWGYDVAAVTELADKVRTSFLELQDPAAATMIDFDDRDLLGLAETAGFEEVHLASHIDVQPASEDEPGSVLRPHDLAGFLDIAPNPLAPTIGEAINHALTGPERERFVAHLQRAFEEQRAVRRSAVAYLTARKRA